MKNGTVASRRHHGMTWPAVLISGILMAATCLMAAGAAGAFTSTVSPTTKDAIRRNLHPVTLSAIGGGPSNGRVG